MADPCAGLVAAAAVVTALAAGGRWLLDVAMARVAAHLAGPTLDASAATEAAPSLPLGGVEPGAWARTTPGSWSRR